MGRWLDALRNRKNYVDRAGIGFAIDHCETPDEVVEVDDEFSDGVRSTSVRPYGAGWYIVEKIHGRATIWRRIVVVSP